MCLDPQPPANVILLTHMALPSQRYYGCFPMFEKIAAAVCTNVPAVKGTALSSTCVAYVGYASSLWPLTRAGDSHSNPQPNQPAGCYPVIPCPCLVPRSPASTIPSRIPLLTQRPHGSDFIYQRTWAPSGLVHPLLVRTPVKGRATSRQSSLPALSRPSHGYVSLPSA